MAMQKTHDLVATIGKYKARDGTEKKRYITIGSIFTDDQGRRSYKLDALPLGPEWSGWASEYPVERNNQRDRDPRDHAPRTQQPPPRDETAGWDSNEPAPDEIPF